jgi:WD40 repeat protein
MSEAADKSAQCQSHFKLGINTDEVMYLEEKKWLVVGGYELLDGKTQKKRGIISIHPTQFDPSPTISPLPRIQYHVAEGGVFQLERGLTVESGLLWASLSQSDIISLELSEGGDELKEKMRLKVPEVQGDSLSSSAVACTGIHLSSSSQMNACYSDGSIRVWNIEGGGAVEWQNQTAHEMEAWQLLRVDENTLVSAGDDAAFCVWDIRQSGSSGPTSAVRSFYQGGVTSIAALDASRPNMLAIGSYDESLAVWDIRALSGRRSQPLSSISRIGGGVWRIKKCPNPDETSSKVRLLAACMHAGWRCIDVDLTQSGDQMLQRIAAFDYPSSEAVKDDSTKAFPHNLPSALAYGACWLSSEWAAGCSFYDNTVSCWHLPTAS